MSNEEEYLNIETDYTWAHLDEANKADGHYNKHPQHEDYYAICREVERARSEYFLKCKFFECSDGTVTSGDVQKAEEYYRLCEDAERYMWALYYHEDCSCLPDSDMCHFCKMGRRYNEWKESQK